MWNVEKCFLKNNNKQYRKKALRHKDDIIQHYSKYTFCFQFFLVLTQCHIFQHFEITKIFLKFFSTQNVEKRCFCPLISPPILFIYLRGKDNIFRNYVKTKYITNFNSSLKYLLWIELCPQTYIFFYKNNSLRADDDICEHFGEYIFCFELNLKTFCFTFIVVECHYHLSKFPCYVNWFFKGQRQHFSTFFETTM